MRIALARSLSFMTLALGAITIGAVPAAAQAFPPGSYQRSCTQIHWSGSTLVAECSRSDGRTTGTGLPNALRCHGDIGNNDGQLQCNYAGGQQPAPIQTPPPPPGYGGYGAPPNPGYGGYEEHHAHCDELWHREAELRDRLQYTPFGPDRERLEDHLHEVHEDRERAGCER